MALDRLRRMVLLGAATLSACADRPLGPDFAISWSEDQGFLSTDLLGSELRFGETAIGSVTTLALELANPGDINLRGLRLEWVRVETAKGFETVVEHPPLGPIDLSIGEVPPSLGAGEVAQVALTFGPSSPDPLDPGLRLAIRHELNWDPLRGWPMGRGVLHLPIDASPILTPSLVVRPQALDFGLAMVGETSSPKWVHVRNEGSGLLRTEAAQIIGDPDFHIVPPDTVTGGAFASGEETGVAVVFGPIVAGSQDAQLVVTSNDPQVPEQRVWLHGEAFDPAAAVPPVAVCGPDRVSAPGRVESLDGSGSYCPQGLRLSYFWTFVPPSGSATHLTDYSSSSPRIEPFLDSPGDYVGTLTVENAWGLASGPCVQRVTALPPTLFQVDLVWMQNDDWDLHLLAPGGTTFGALDCWQGNCAGAGTLDWGVPGVPDDDPEMSVNAGSMTGPTRVEIDAPADAPYDGCYTVLVHDSPTYSDTMNIPGTVNLFLGGVLTQAFTITLAGEDAWHSVAQVHWPSGVVVACAGLGGCTSPCP